MFETSDKLRAERETITPSARAEKAVAHPGPQRRHDVRITRSDDADVTSSQAGASQVLDPTQHKQ